MNVMQGLPRADVSGEPLHYYIAKGKVQFTRDYTG